jgi:putative ABC transport system permease protein
MPVLLSASWGVFLFETSTTACASFVRAPGFAAVAILTLALGIGGSTAMFSLLYHVLLKPLPYPHPDRLAITLGIAKTEGFAAASMPDYLDFRAQSSAFEHLAAHAGRTSNIIDPGPVEVVRGAQASNNFFAMIGVAPLGGSTLNAATDSRTVVVISHDLWQNRFASAPGAIRGTITGRSCAPRHRHHAARFQPAKRCEILDAFW